eukprot:6212347-Pleurochrysis_carterae.AAC.5
MASPLMSSRAARLLEDVCQLSVVDTVWLLGARLPGVSAERMRHLSDFIADAPAMLAHAASHTNWLMSDGATLADNTHPCATARTHRHGASQAADLHRPGRPIQAVQVHG